MKNDNRNTMGDDEYQYPNEEYVTETAPIEETEPVKKAPNFFVQWVQNNKRLALVILIVLLMLIGFKLLGLRNHTVIVPTPKPAVAEVVVPPVTTEPTAMVPSALDRLQQANEKNQTTINQLQAQVQDLRNSLAQNATVQSQLNQSMTALTAEVKQLATLVQDSQKPVVKVKKAAVLPSPPLVFHLRAIVPGRAWIVSNDGLSESVTTGDSVPQYGTVQVVDANRGMVLTSSGKVISYGENDR